MGSECTSVRLVVETNLRLGGSRILTATSLVDPAVSGGDQNHISPGSKTGSTVCCSRPPLEVVLLNSGGCNNQTISASGLESLRLVIGNREP